MNREELKKIIRGVSVAVPTPFDNNYHVSTWPRRPTSRSGGSVKGLARTHP